MHETRLQNDEIETLLEALKAWEDKDLSGEILSTVVESMLMSKQEKNRSEFIREREERKREAEVAKRKRKETSVLLQAKLIQMRNAADVDTFIAGALRSG